MQNAHFVERINQLPFETWLCLAESAQQMSLPSAEVEKLLRAGRRCGMITVRREEGPLQFKRVRRRPIQQTRRDVPHR
ncbi:hypothetical protein ACWDZ4_20005 [Streptomyces sp. NPDC003016]